MGTNNPMAQNITDFSELKKAICSKNRATKNKFMQKEIKKMAAKAVSNVLETKEAENLLLFLEDKKNEKLPRGAVDDTAISGVTTDESETLSNNIDSSDANSCASV